MRRPLAIGGVLVAGAAVGVGGLLAYQEIREIPRASGNGLAVICDELEENCWQQGRRVQVPREGGACLAEAGTTPLLWGRTGAGPALNQGWIYYCGAGD